jgi:hypothetical protein
MKCKFNEILAHHAFTKGELLARVPIEDVEKIDRIVSDDTEFTVAVYRKDADTVVTRYMSDNIPDGPEKENIVKIEFAKNSYSFRPIVSSFESAA